MKEKIKMRLLVLGGAIIVIIIIFIIAPNYPSYHANLSLCIQKATENYSEIYRGEVNKLSFKEINDNDTRYLEARNKCYDRYYPSFQENEFKISAKDLDPFYIPELIRNFMELPPQGKMDFASRVFSLDH